MPPDPMTDPTPATPDEAVALRTASCALGEASAAIGLRMSDQWWAEVLHNLIAAGWTLSRQQGDTVAARVDEAMVGRVARALCDERGEDWDWTVAHDPGFADALRTVAREALLGVGDRDGGQR